MDVREHLELSWSWRVLHNELAAIGRGEIVTERLDLRRIYLSTFMTMVEGVAYQIRQYLLKKHSQGDIKISPEEVTELSKDFYRTSDMFKLTWRTFGKYLDKADVVDHYFSNAGMASMMATITKRNLVTHPKQFPDLCLSAVDWKEVRKASAWHHEMTNRVLEGNIYDVSEVPEEGTSEYEP